jgi:hypothetical protein
MVEENHAGLPQRSSPSRLTRNASQCAAFQCVYLGVRVPRVAALCARPQPRQARHLAPESARTRTKKFPRCAQRSVAWPLLRTAWMHRTGYIQSSRRRFYAPQGYRGRVGVCLRARAPGSNRICGQPARRQLRELQGQRHSVWPGPAVPSARAIATNRVTGAAMAAPVNSDRRVGSPFQEDPPGAGSLPGARPTPSKFRNSSKRPNSSKLPKHPVARARSGPTRARAPVSR